MGQRVVRIFVYDFPRIDAYDQVIPRKHHLQRNDKASRLLDVHADIKFRIVIHQFLCGIAQQLHKLNHLRHRTDRRRRRKLVIVAFFRITVCVYQSQDGQVSVRLLPGKRPIGHQILQPLEKSFLIPLCRYLLRDIFVDTVGIRLLQVQVHPEPIRDLLQCISLMIHTVIIGIPGNECAVLPHERDLYGGFILHTSIQLQCRKGISGNLVLHPEIQRICVQVEPPGLVFRRQHLAAPSLKLPFGFPGRLLLFCWQRLRLYPEHRKLHHDKPAKQACCQCSYQNDRPLFHPVTTFSRFPR